MAPDRYASPANPLQALPFPRLAQFVLLVRAEIGSESADYFFESGIRINNMKGTGLLMGAALSLGCGTAMAEITANASVTNNYLWRGLTQSLNQAAVQGGLDYASESGFYAGTWVSNVEYAPGDPYSYEHDIYFGYSGESGDLTYDIGWLYYNYDAAADIDFHELYGTIGYGGFSATAYLLGGTEADEAPYEADFGVTGADFGFWRSLLSLLRLRVRNREWARHRLTCPAITTATS